MRCSAILALLLLAAGCNEGRCVRHSDCDPAFVCSAAGHCEARADGGTTADPPDASDAGAPSSDASDASAATDATLR